MTKENNTADEKGISGDDLEKRLQDCQKQKEEYLAGWQRSRADFLNYKKEEMQRIGKIMKYANIELVLRILRIVDDLERGEKLLPKDLKNNQFVKGILQIKNQLQDLLKSQGVEEMKAVSGKFDPNFQEVVEEIEEKDKEAGLVIEEVQKGYLLHDRVLRPARVKISK